MCCCSQISASKGKPTVLWLLRPPNIALVGLDILDTLGALCSLGCLGVGNDLVLRKRRCRLGCDVDG